MAAFTTHAAVRLRKAECIARAVFVFLQPAQGWSASDSPYKNGLSIPVSPTQDSRLLIGAAIHGLKNIFRKGTAYRKAGVILLDVRPGSEQEGSLWSPERNLGEKVPLMVAIDGLNTRFGAEIVRFGSTTGDQPWVCIPENRSGRYTTHVDELMCVK